MESDCPDGARRLRTSGSVLEYVEDCKDESSFPTRELALLFLERAQELLEEGVGPEPRFGFSCSKGQSVGQEHTMPHGTTLTKEVL